MQMTTLMNPDWLIFCTRWNFGHGLFYFIFFKEK